MKTFKTQSLDEFYKDSPCISAEINHTQYFNVFNIDDRPQSATIYPNYTRRDFYKILLFQGCGVFHYGDQSITINNNTLLFFNPRVPYTYDPVTEEIAGYFCIFKDDFFKENLRLNLDEIPLFTPGVKPVFALSGEDFIEVESLFKKIIKEFNSQYTYKYDLIRSYVSELIYYAMKLEPSKFASPEINAGARITSVFLELLDRQFPVELYPYRILLRTPKDFADTLAIHVNYLNRAIKKETGKTTSGLIFDRLVAEAKAMLKHTNLNIAEISYTLGFEDQAHFNNFFKKQAKVTPSAFRLV